MAIPFYFYLSNQGLHVYRWQGKVLLCDLVFNSPATAREQLKKYYADQGGKPVRLVVDILEESYSLESLPHLGMKDREALIKRKKKQLFAGLNFTYSHYKGRGKSERRDDLVLMTAINEETGIRSWLNLFFELQIKLQAIYSLPVLMESFAAQLKGKDNKLIISLFQSPQGMYLRQSFFKNNHLALSRFKQINTSDRKQIANEIREDINRSQRFIAQKFSLSMANSVSCYFFSSQNISNIEKLYSEIDLNQLNLAAQFIITQDLARSRGKNIAEDFSLSVYVSAMAIKKDFFPGHYQDSSSHFYYRHHVLKKCLNWASISMCLLSGYLLIAMDSESEQITLKTDHQRKLRGTYLKRLAETQDPPIFEGMDPFQVLNRIKVKNEVEDSLISPKILLIPLSQTMNLFPEINLTKISWGKESLRKKKDDEQTAMPSDPAMIDPALTMPEEATLSVILEAEIIDFDGNYRNALQRIENFRLTLENQQKVSLVEAIKLPVNIDKENELKGAIKDTLKKAAFVLELQWLI